MIALLQHHTVELYNLTEKKSELKKVAAKTLVTVNRFDLFAKLGYIKYRESNPNYARELYTEHIKAFNPDLKEPGRDDKNGIDDFINAFDVLIDFFKDNDFDPDISIIPVSGDGAILDGSHRVAALAFYDKDITILQFIDVKAVAVFDYNYFLNRGLSRKWADAIAFEALNFTNHLFVACLWPRLGRIQSRIKARQIIESNSETFYSKDLSMTLENLSMFVYEIYKHQDWVGNQINNFAGARNKAMSCYGNNKIVQFIVFKASSLENVLKIKEEIRNYYQLDKHALHITDNDAETRELLELILTERSKQFSSSSMQLIDQFREFKTLFKNVYLINLKVKIAKLLKVAGFYK